MVAVPEEEDKLSDLKSVLCEKSYATDRSSFPQTQISECANWRAHKSSRASHVRKAAQK